MSKLYGGSICLTDLLAKAKEGHSAFIRSQNGKVYCNVNIWMNDEVDKFGNIMSFQLNSQKDKREAEGKIYIGNAKEVVAAAPAPVKADEEEFNDDLPF